MLIFALFACKNVQKLAKNTEPHRPLYHFTPSANWMNDPNGMVFYKGEWHLFYQHHPASTVWGPMHWGHAVSRDLVHWQHLPIALFPDSLGLIFSGSAVVDWNNTSGFGINGEPPLVAIFTHHSMEGEKAGRQDFQYQSIAFSNDRGRTWTKYVGNPVIPNTMKIRDFRDTKVIWDAASNQWVMVLAAQDHAQFWGSSNLKNWHFLSDFGKEYGGHRGVWECPDLFPVQVEHSEQKKWVLLQSLNPGAANGGSGTQYFVGDFDGKTFTLDPDFEKTVRNGQAQWLDFGRDNYAGVTWSDVPKSDGRRVFLGWMSNWDYATVVPTEKWRSATTLPRELTLKKEANQWRLYAKPVSELKKLRKKAYTIAAVDLNGVFDLKQQFDFAPSCSELELEFQIPEKSPAQVAIVLSNSKGEQFSIGFDAEKNQFFSDRRKSGKLDFSEKFATKIEIAPRASRNRTIKMHLFFDVASCELFADDGSVVMTDIFFPTEPYHNMTISSTNGAVKLLNGTIHRLSASK
jgi:fructan beta-fructosidase